MYVLALASHSWFRWLLLGAAVVGFGRSLVGWRAGRTWDPTDEKIAKAVVILLHLQLVVGFALYAWLSPVTAAAFRDFGAAMKDAPLRFFAVEHATGMMLAFVTLMVTRVRSKRVAVGADRHRAWAFGLGLFLAIVALAIPWPGLRHGRPWFRGL